MKRPRWEDYDYEYLQFPDSKVNRFSFMGNGLTYDHGKLRCVLHSRNYTEGFSYQQVPTCPHISITLSLPIFRNSVSPLEDVACL